MADISVLPNDRSFGENDESQPVAVIAEHVTFLESDGTTKTKAKQLVISDVEPAEVPTVTLSGDSEECMVAHAMSFDGANGLPTNTENYQGTQNDVQQCNDLEGEPVSSFDDESAELQQEAAIAKFEISVDEELFSSELEPDVRKNGESQLLSLKEESSQKSDHSNSEDETCKEQKEHSTAFEETSKEGVVTSATPASQALDVATENISCKDADETETNDEKQLVESEVTAAVPKIKSSDSEDYVVAHCMAFHGANGLPTNTQGRQQSNRASSPNDSDNHELTKLQKDNSILSSEKTSEEDATPPKIESEVFQNQEPPLLTRQEEADHNDLPPSHPTNGRVSLENFKCTDVHHQILEGLYDDNNEGMSDKCAESEDDLYSKCTGVSLSTATAPNNAIPILQLPNFKPASGCTTASDFIVRCFLARLRAGITVVKHGRSRWCKSRLRIIYIEEDGTMLRWKPAAGEPQHSRLSQIPLDLSQCSEVRHSWEPDPQNPMFTGTATLRKKCEAANAHKSFALIFPHRTVDITAITADQAKVLMEGFSALCFRLQIGLSKDVDTETETTSKSTFNPASLDSTALCKIKEIKDGQD
mmetsp:Transcript_26625/g.40271  ORF Transcript_26625/g.40271 Transcript_26625/m.40271 type:complete len:590 (+) Transcript_26625:121-1890(+)|eukprot:CAMPEP_0178913408 /NCGR_PEP_ID=MMETSP0786-20121207/10822_1 /TAXON_ID=186022 /ORGANISM="Thalassionema frauenfeldii, Strain CCMP 1798" /LENGTH=589 /DNA_ID=CAMNT_0020586139 /DNA_START=278 /DNA_END=2047 /DNA_ORIENTATION=-